jgi:hypothetical protein
VLSISLDFYKVSLQTLQQWKDRLVIAIAIYDDLLEDLDADLEEEENLHLPLLLDANNN